MCDGDRAGRPMTVYSVSDAQANLAQLIDNALDGEEVVITRDGLPVVELRPAAGHARTAMYEWLIACRGDPGRLAL
jgi:prevent-host-death family protein